jgi:uncharacterized membrane protein HdeD (DUF308 family)
MSDHSEPKQQSWWKLVLAGLLAIAFGIAAILLPGGIMFGRVLDMLFGVAKPFSASVTAIAVFLSLVALVAIDGLVNLFGAGLADKRAAQLRGIIGLATAIAAIFWPEKTTFVAVELVGLWAIVIGVLELLIARYTGKDPKDRTLLILAAIASIVIGVGLMMKAFAGAILIGAIVGIAAAARGISLIVSGISERSPQLDGTQVIRRGAA